MQTLPIEMICLVFSKISEKDLMGNALVCKTWNNIICAHFPFIFWYKRPWTIKIEKSLEFPLVYGEEVGIHYPSEPTFICSKYFG